MYSLLLIVLIFLAIALLLWLVFGINWRSMRNYERRHQRFRSRLQAEASERLKRLLFGIDQLPRIEERFRPLAQYLSANERLGVSTTD